MHRPVAVSEDRSQTCSDNIYNHGADIERGVSGTTIFPQFLSATHQYAFFRSIRRNKFAIKREINLEL